MSDFVSHLDWRTICGAAATLFLQSSLVLILGLGASAFLRKRGAAVRSAVLRATLAAVIVCPAVAMALRAVGIPSVRFSLPLPTQVSNVTPAETPSGGDGAAVDVPSRPVQTSVKSASTVTPSPVSDGRRSPGLPLGTLPPITEASTAHGSGVNAYAVCATLWFIVAALLTLRLLIANALLAHARHAARSAPDSIRRACGRIARELHVTAPNLLISQQFQSPCLIGWLRPAILLPERNADLSDEVFLHEIAHVVRHDCLWQLLARLMAAALWFQPLAWLLVRQIERAAEEACDDVVLAHGGDRRAYARRLVELAERLQPGNLAAAAAVGVVSFKSDVGKRIARLLDGSNSPRTDIGRLSLTGIVLGSLLAAVSAGLLGLKSAARAAEQRPSAVYGGQVLSSDGRPVAGVDVYLVKSTLGARDVIESTQSDSQGNFQLHKVPTASPEISPYEIQAHLSGQGVGSERYDATKSVCRVTLKPSTRITLTIVDPDAKPIAGMKVYPMDFVSAPINIEGSPRGIFFMNLPLTLSHRLEGVTDAQGRITLTDVPQGTQVRVGFDDERFAYPGPRKRVGVSDHDVVSPPATLQLDRGAVATGTVRYGPTGKPASGVGVSLQSTNRDFSASGGSGRTSNDGTFRITHLTAGEFNAMILLDQDLAKDWTAAAREWVKIQGGQTLGGLDFTLVKGGIVTGKVTMADSGNPITNTRIGEYGPARPRSSAAVQGTTVGPDGSYKLRVPPGTQHVYIMGLLPQAYRQDRQMSQDVKIEDGQTVTLDFKVPRQAGEAVAGVVIALNGNPAANIPVRAQTGGIGDGFTFTSTDAGGHFHFDALAPSTPITVQSGDLATAEPVYVQKGQGEVKLQLIRRVKLTLKGLITDEQGNPVPNAHIRLSQQMGRFGRGEGTPRIGGPDGRYEIKDLYTDNQFSIAADADGFGEAQARLHLEAGTKELPTLKLPRPDSTTGGVVVDSEGKPVSGVTVHLNNGMSPKTAVTDAEGRFSFPVVAGKYHLIWIAVKEQGKVGPHANGLGGRTDLKLVLPKEEQ